MTETATDNAQASIASPTNLKKYAIIAVPVVLAIGAYVLWPGGQLSCSSPDAQGLVLDIAKEKGAMLSVLEGRYRSSGGDNRFKQATRLEESPE